MGGLGGLHKLAVAVVHQNGRVGVGLLDDPAHCPDLSHREGRTGGITSGPLDQHRLHTGIGGGFGDFFQVGLVVQKLYLPVLHPVVLQGTGSLIHRAHNAQQGVVRCADSGYQHVAAFQRSEQGAGDGVGAVDKLNPHQSGLGAKQAGIDLVQFIPAQIVVAVAGGAGKISVGNPMLLKGRQHPCGILPCNGVDTGKFPGQLFLGLDAQRFYTVVEL